MRVVLVPLAVEAVLEAVPALLHHGEDGLEEHLQGRADEVLQDQLQVHLEVNAYREGKYFGEVKSRGENVGGRREGRRKKFGGKCKLAVGWGKSFRFGGRISQFLSSLDSSYDRLFCFRFYSQHSSYFLQFIEDKGSLFSKVSIRSFGEIVFLDRDGKRALTSWGC